MFILLLLSTASYAADWVVPHDGRRRFHQRLRESTDLRRTLWPVQAIYQENVECRVDVDRCHSTHGRRIAPVVFYPSAHVRRLLVPGPTSVQGLSRVYRTVVAIMIDTFI